LIKENSKLFNIFFDKLDYEKHIIENSLDKILNVDLVNYGDVERKWTYTPFHNVDPNLSEPFPVELDDICRLHWLVRTRKVTTILEIGLGKSTIAFDDAMASNKSQFGDFVTTNLRRDNPFEVHTVDNNQNWVNVIRDNHDLPSVRYHLTDLQMGTFNGRICTYYDTLPNICPDFIYLDGPDQFSVNGSIRGVTTAHKDRLPMSADVLALEHFLLPGTLIAVDGRTANARFLKSNLQRNWLYFHYVEADQHFFELAEQPLGPYNKKQIDYCLGDEFYNRVIG
jgi:hypothetical protein